MHINVVRALKDRPLEVNYPMKFHNAKVSRTAMKMSSVNLSMNLVNLFQQWLEVYADFSLSAASNLLASTMLPLFPGIFNIKFIYFNLLIF